MKADVTKQNQSDPRPGCGSVSIAFCSFVCYVSRLSLPTLSTSSLLLPPCSSSCSSSSSLCRRSHSGFNIRRVQNYFLYVFFLPGEKTFPDVSHLECRSFPTHHPRCHMSLAAAAAAEEETGPEHLHALEADGANTNGLLPHHPSSVLISSHPVVPRLSFICSLDQFHS